MTQKEKKHFLQVLDEFLACFDPEELIRDGIQFVKFRYEHRGKKIEKLYTPETLKQEQERRKETCNM